MTGHVSWPDLTGGANAAVPGPLAGTGAEKGKWNGLAVTVSGGPMSLVSQAAEEMRHSADQFVKREVEERRRLQSHQHRHFHLVLPPRAALEHIQREAMERILKLREKSAVQHGDQARFARDAEEAFPDPTERHAAFLWLEENAGESPGPEAFARAERERLETEAGGEVQAGYNLDGVDAGDVGGANGGRELYRSAVLGYSDVALLFEEILSRYEEQGFASAVEYLRRAIGADLSAANPSTDKHALEAMNNDLYHLRALGDFTGRFDAELARLRAQSGKPPLPLAGLRTLRLFCKVKNERLIILDGLRGILSLGGEATPVYDVQALTRARNLAHSLPVKLFPDEDARQRLLAAGQKMLDAAIDLEDGAAEGRG